MCFASLKTLYKHVSIITPCGTEVENFCHWEYSKTGWEAAC